MSRQINNPGEAMRMVQAVLRQNGYGTDEVAAKSNRHDLDCYLVTGQLQRIEDGQRVGQFQAEVERDGYFEISAGAFGTITPTGVDPFVGL